MRVGMDGSNFFTLTLTLSLKGRGDRLVPPFTLAPLGRGGEGAGFPPKFNNL